jgi:uncharacterized RDD family membrane protein YckC
MTEPQDPTTAVPEPTPPVTPPVAGPPKADIGKRIVAAIIDAVIAAILGFIPAIGGLIGAAYILVRDGLEFDFMDQRSVGKKVLKLRPVTLDGSPVDVVTSIKRNWMFCLGGLIPLLIFIPILGWMMIPFVGLAALVLGVIELVLVLTDANGRRFGDKIANTQVIEVDD